MSGNKNYEDAEGRLTVAEVPQQISRLFFGDPQPSYNPPSNSYGPPPSYNGGGSGVYPLYPGYFEDIKLLVKLGQAALIVFMILAVVAMAFMIILAILYCFGSRSSSRDDELGGDQYSRQTGYKSPSPRSEFSNAGFLPSEKTLRSPTRRRSDSSGTYANQAPPPSTQPLPRSRAVENLTVSDGSSRPSHSKPKRDTSSDSSTSVDNVEILPKRMPSTKKPSIFDGRDQAAIGRASDKKTSRHGMYSPTLSSDKASISDRTGETVIKRPLPHAPEGSSSSGTKRKSKKQASQHSDSTDISQNRSDSYSSVPYYEVPAPQSYPTRKATLTSTQPPLPLVPPPQGLDAAALQARSRRPFTYLEPADQQQPHQSRLI